MITFASKILVIFGLLQMGNWATSAHASETKELGPTAIRLIDRSGLIDLGQFDVELQMSCRYSRLIELGVLTAFHENPPCKASSKMKLTVGIDGVVQVPTGRLEVESSAFHKIAVERTVFVKSRDGQKWSEFHLLLGESGKQNIDIELTYVPETTFKVDLSKLQPQVTQKQFLVVQLHRHHGIALTQSVQLGQELQSKLIDLPASLPGEVQVHYSPFVLASMVGEPRSNTLAITGEIRIWDDQYQRLITVGVQRRWTDIDETALARLSPLKLTAIDPTPYPKISYGPKDE